MVGAGYLGLEMAEALHTRGVAVTVAEAQPMVMPTLDKPIASLVADESGGMALSFDSVRNSTG